MSNFKISQITEPLASGSKNLSKEVVDSIVGTYKDQVLKPEGSGGPKHDPSPFTGTK